jgi:hypothetical protein
VGSTYDSVQLGGPFGRHRCGVEASADAVKAVGGAYRDSMRGAYAMLDAAADEWRTWRYCLQSILEGQQRDVAG